MRPHVWHGVCCHRHGRADRELALSEHRQCEPAFTAPGPGPGTASPLGKSSSCLTAPCKAGQLSWCSVGWAPAALSPSSLEETLKRQIPSLGLRSCCSDPVSSPAPMCSHRLAVDVCTGLFEPRSSPLLTAKCWQPPLRVQRCSASGAPLLPPEGCCSTCSPGTVDTRCLSASGKGRGKMFYICPGPKRLLVGSGYI